MSISQFLKTHEASGQLKRFLAPQGQSNIRGLMLCERAQKELYGDKSALHYHRCAGHVQSLLERWVTGQEMAVRISGKKRDAFLALLKLPPPEVWEFRATQPNPQFRIFGRFLRQDVFVATDIISRQLLGKDGSAAWKQAMNGCVTEWQKLFGATQPFIGHSINDYVSANWRAIGPAERD